MWNLLIKLVVLLLFLLRVNFKGAKGNTDMQHCFILPTDNPDNFLPGLHQVIMHADNRVITGL